VKDSDTPLGSAETVTNEITETAGTIVFAVDMDTKDREWIALAITKMTAEMTVRVNEEDIEL
jgi:hypothetical protein